MHHPSVSWLINPVKFSSWNIKCFGQKEPIKVQFFRLLSALRKVHPIPHAIVEAAKSGLILILLHCSVWWKITPPLYFCSSNFEKTHRKESPFSDFRIVGWKSTEFLSYLKLQVCFYLKFASLFGVMRDNPSVFFFLPKHDFKVDLDEI